MWRERRSTVRHVVELPIRYRVLSQSQWPRTQVTPSSQPNKTRNISDSGLLFLSSECFKVGTVLELTFPARDKVFTMEGHVVHAGRDSESGLHRIGIRFSNADNVFKIKLAEQLYQISHYRSTLSKEEGRIVTEEEAAHRWIEEHSRDFAEFYK